jgi:hypothetical protein
MYTGDLYIYENRILSALIIYSPFLDNDLRLLRILTASLAAVWAMLLAGTIHPWNPSKPVNLETMLYLELLLFEMYFAIFYKLDIHN